MSISWPCLECMCDANVGGLLDPIMRLKYSVTVVYHAPGGGDGGVGGA